MIDVVERLLEEDGHVRVVQVVDDAPSVPLAHDKSEVAEQPKLVRDGRLLHADGRSKLSDRARRLLQPGEDTDAARRPERLHRLGDLARDLGVECGRLGLSLDAMLPLIALAALAAADPAYAHGIHANSASTVADFVWLGFKHMIVGWDHLLFAAGIVFLAGSAGRAATLISLFVAGHSSTLLIATLGDWRVNPAVVDVVIALSVVCVGLRLLAGRPARWRVTGLAIFGFGLVHGLGLATRLQDLNLPEGSALVVRILAFNLGIEVGQLVAVSALVAAAILTA